MLVWRGMTRFRAVRASRILATIMRGKRVVRIHCPPQTTTFHRCLDACGIVSGRPIDGFGSSLVSAVREMTSSTSACSSAGTGGAEINANEAKDLTSPCFWSGVCAGSMIPKWVGCTSMGETFKTIKKRGRVTLAALVINVGHQTKGRYHLSRPVGHVDGKQDRSALSNLHGLKEKAVPAF